MVTQNLASRSRRKSGGLADERKARSRAITEPGAESVLARAACKRAPTAAFLGRTDHKDAGVQAARARAVTSSDPTPKDDDPFLIPDYPALSVKTIIVLTHRLLINKICGGGGYVCSVRRM